MLLTIFIAAYFFIFFFRNKLRFSLDFQWNVHFSETVIFSSEGVVGVYLWQDKTYKYMQSGKKRFKKIPCLPTIYLNHIYFFGLIDNFRIVFTIWLSKCLVLKRPISLEQLFWTFWEIKYIYNNLVCMSREYSFTEQSVKTNTNWEVLWLTNLLHWTEQTLLCRRKMAPASTRAVQIWMQVAS